jgi:hypothetical protein
MITLSRMWPSKTPVFRENSPVIANYELIGQFQESAEFSL